MVLLSPHRPSDKARAQRLLTFNERDFLAFGEPTSKSSAQPEPPHGSPTIRVVLLTMVVDHGTDLIMQSMPISKFKATCLATLERVRKTGRPLRVTRFGKPIAEIVPPTPAPAAKNWLGDMRGTAQIVGDITGPSGELVEWEAAK